MTDRGFTLRGSAPRFLEGGGVDGAKSLSAETSFFAEEFCSQLLQSWVGVVLCGVGQGGGQTQCVCPGPGLVRPGTMSRGRECVYVPERGEVLVLFFARRESAVLVLARRGCAQASDGSQGHPESAPGIAGLAVIPGMARPVMPTPWGKSTPGARPVIPGPVKHRPGHPGNRRPGCTPPFLMHAQATRGRHTGVPRS